MEATVDPGRQCFEAERLEEVRRGVSVIERAFGDPWDEANAFGVDQVLRCDRAGTTAVGYPARIVTTRVCEHIVPRIFGGRFSGLDTLGLVMRALYRRDGATATQWGYNNTQAWCFVQLTGDLRLQRRTVDQLLAGRLLGTAFHRFEGGQEWAAEEFTARMSRDQVLVSGRKRNVGAATDLAGLVVVAATGEAATPYTLLLLEPPELPPAQVWMAPSPSGDGLRGMPIGEIVMADAAVPRRRILGQWGRGLQAGLSVLPAIQVALPPMLIGMADTALRVAARVESESPQRVSPDVSPLGTSFADVLVADALALVAARVVHLSPRGCHVIAAASRHLVPLLLRDALLDLVAALGDAYHGAREGLLLSKQLRDLSELGLTEAGLSNALTAICAHLPSLARPEDAAGPERAELLRLFQLDEPLPDLDPGALAHFGGEDGMAGYVAGLHRVLDEARLLLGDDDLAQPVDDLVAEVRRLRTQCATLTPSTPSTTRLALADRYAHILAGAAVLGVWLNSGSGPSSLALGSSWVRVGLDRILARLGLRRQEDRHAIAKLHAEVIRRTRERLSLDLLPVEVGG